MGQEQENYSLEENFARLESTMELLEREDISLEEAFRAYSKGMTILKQCNDQIDHVEKQVLKLNEEGQLEEFGDGNTEV
ncbi:MAG: exodeoxyribonuclease VII small subunit [Acetatifactor sp.]|nr:exodeoxyribonuclease VII small subunit [Acetatifactor sp.]